MVGEHEEMRPRDLSGDGVIILERILERVAVAQAVERLSYGLDDRGSIPGRGNVVTFSLCHRVQTSSGAHGYRELLSRG
jgi:hypothetical protein